VLKNPGGIIGVYQPQSITPFQNRTIEPPSKHLPASIQKVVNRIYGNEMTGIEAKELDTVEVLN